MRNGAQAPHHRLNVTQFTFLKYLEQILFLVVFLATVGMKKRKKNMTYIDVLQVCQTSGEEEGEDLPSQMTKTFQYFIGNIWVDALQSHDTGMREEKEGYHQAECAADGAIGRLFVG
jgi:hypothetical protein